MNRPLAAAETRSPGVGEPAPAVQSGATAETPAAVGATTARAVTRAVEPTWTVAADRASTGAGEPAATPPAAARLAIPVSVIVMTKNEESNIAKCLRSARAFDQVFVVDSASTDRTCEIATAMGATVAPFAWNGRYPKKKQWCLEELPFRHDLVLYLDADEEVTPELVDEIRRVAHAPRHAGYFVGYDYVFLGRVLRHGHRVYKLVLLNRHKARFPERDDLDVANMWEVEGHYQPQVDGRVGTLRARMRHEDHASLFHYFERHNRYSDWEARLRARGTLLAVAEPQPGARGLLKALFAQLPGKGLVAFLHCYVGRAGFLDGWAGFHYAVARGFYYWQIGITTRTSSTTTTRPAIRSSRSGGRAAAGACTSS